MRKKLLALILAMSLVLPLLPAIPVLAGNTVTVVVNFYREDGQYQDNDVWVGSFGASPTFTNSVWTTLPSGWRQTEFTISNVQFGDYIAFQLMNDSIWQNDLRYIDPWGPDFGAVGTMPSTIEIWLVDGDLRAFSEPVRVDERFVTARDGIRYMALQGIFYTLNPGHTPGAAPPRGRDVFTVHLGALTNISEPGPLATGGNVARWIDADGNRASDPSRPPGQQINNFHIVTINRDAVRTAGVTEYGVVIGANTGGQGDWFEVAPEMGTMIVNFANQLYTAAQATGPFSSWDGQVNYSGRNLANGEIFPGFVPVDIFYENTTPHNGFTFMSLGSLERIMATVVPKAFGSDVYLMPTIFVAYDAVTDITNYPHLQEAAGFTTYGLVRTDDWIRMHADATDGMPMGMSITRYGKMVFNSVHGDALKYDSGTARGRVLPHNERVPATTDTLFDLASNSKMYGAIFAIQALVSDGRLDLDRVLNTVPGWENMTDAHWLAWRNSPDVNTGSFGGSGGMGLGRDNMTIRQVLTHTSRFAPDPEYMDAQRAGDLYFQWDHNASRAQNVQDFIDVLVLTPLADGVGGAPIYSDVNFLIAAILIEQLSGQSVDAFMHNIYANMGLTHTWYNPLRHGFTENDAAATEMAGNTRDGFRSFGYLDDGVTPVFMREYALRGEVHDEKSFYLLDGAGGSAGLFSTTGDMASLMQLAQNAGVYNGHRVFDRAVHDEFRMPLGGAGSFGIGWRVQNRSIAALGNMDTASRFFSYGHQGWTGTITTIDPVNGMATVGLSSSFGPNIAVNNAAGHNAFLQRQHPFASATPYHGPGAYLLQNVFAYAALRTYDDNVREWTVHFDLGGGSGAPASLTVRDGNFIPNYALTRSSFEFAGWYTDSSFTTPWDLENDRVMSNMTLYANWGTTGLAPVNHSVLFVTGDDVVDVQSVIDGETAVEIEFPNFAHDRGARVARPGFRFDGWYTDSTHTTPFDFAEPIDADTTVYAKMTPVFTVAFNTDGGSQIWPQFVASGEAPIQPPFGPNKFGAAALGRNYARYNSTSQQFNGWFTAPVGGSAFNFGAPVTSDTTVYAQWTNRWSVIPVYVGMPNHLLAADAAGSTGQLFNNHGFAVLDGQTAPLIGPPSVIPVGFTFEGWFYDMALTMPFNQADPIWTNTVLYPKFVMDITSANITIPEPLAGQLPTTQLRIASPGQNAVLTNDIVGYIATLEWFSSDTDMPVVGPFGFGDYYAIVSLTSVGLSGARAGAGGNSSGPMPTTLTPKTLYRWNPDSIPAITVNGELIDADIISIEGGHVTGNVATFSLDFHIPEFSLHIFNNGYGGTPSTPNASLAEAGLIRMWTQLNGETAPVPYADLEIEAVLPDDTCAMEFIRIHRVEDNVISIDADKNASWQRIYFTATLFGQTIEAVLVNGLYESQVFGLHAFNNGNDNNASLAQAGVIRIWTQLDGVNALVPYADLEVEAVLPDGLCAMEFIRINQPWANPGYVNLIDANKHAPWHTIYLTATLNGQIVELTLVNNRFLDLRAYNNGTDAEVPSMAGNIRIWPLLGGSGAPIPMTAVITAVDQDDNDAMQFVTKNRQWTDAGWRDYHINFDVTKDAPWETIIFIVTVYGQTVTLLLINDWFTDEPEPKPVFGLQAFNNGTDTQVPSLAGTIRIWTQLDDVTALVPFADLEIDATLLDGTCALEFVRINRIWNNPDYVNLFDVSKDAEWQYINFSVTLFGQTVELMLINDRYDV